MYLHRVGISRGYIRGTFPSRLVFKTGAAIDGNWTSQSDSHEAEMTETRGARRLQRPHLWLKKGRSFRFGPVRIANRRDSEPKGTHLRREFVPS